MGVPNSSDILTNYKAYVEMIKDVNDIIVKNNLTDKKTFIILKNFNKQFPSVITELMNSMKNVDTILKGINFEDTSNNIELVSKGLSSTIKLVKDISNTITLEMFIKFKIGIMLFNLCWKDIFILIAEVAKFSYNDEKTGKIISSEDNLKNSTKTIKEIIKTFEGLSSIIKDFSKLGTKSLKAKMALKGVLRFWNSLIRMIDKMNNPKNIAEIQKSIPVLLSIFNVIKAMKSVMGAIIIMGLGAIIAIPAMLGTMLFMVGLKFIIMMIVKMSKGVKRAILVCSFMMKLSIAILLTVISMMLIGFFVMKWGNLLIKGIMVFILVTVGLVLFLAMIAMAKPIINAGAKEMLLMVLSLFITCLGFILIMELTKKMEWEQFAKASAIMGVCVGIFMLLAFSSELIEKGGLEMILMSSSLLIIVLALWLGSILLKPIEAETFVKLGIIVASVVAIYAILGIPAVASLVGLGGFVMGLISASLIVFALGMLSVSSVARIVKPEAFNNIEAIMPSIINLYKTAFKSIHWITIGSVPLVLLSGTLLALSLSLLTTSIVSKRISTKDIENFVTSIFGIIKTIREDKNLDLSSISDTKRKLSKINEITTYLGNMATTMSKIARLEIADKWNNEGKPIHFVQLTNEDFKRAGDNVFEVATKICNIVRSLDIPEIDYNDMFGLQKVNMITSYLAGMALTISNVAKLQIADGWDKEGKPISYTKLTNEDFINATENVKTIATSIINILNDPGLKAAVASVKPIDEYNWLGKKKEKTSDIDVLSQFFIAAGNISGMVDVVSKIATLQIADKWDSKGQPLHYRKLDSSELDSVVPVVTRIANTLMTALTNPVLMNRIHIFKDTIKDVMGPFFDAASKVGDLVDVVIKLATGSYPIEFNEKTGKPKKYGSFTDLINGSGLIKITNNIAAVVTCISTGVMNAMSKFTEEDLKAMNKKVDNIMNVTKPVSEIIDVIGKMNENKSFKNFDSEKYFNNINSMFSAIVNPFKDESIMSTSDIEKIKMKIPVFKNVNEVFAKLVEVDNSNYTGNVNKVSNATNDFLRTLNSVDTEKLNSMDRIANNMARFSDSINGNFDALATALSEKLVKVIEELNTTLVNTEDKLDGIKNAVTYTTVSAETSDKSNGKNDNNNKNEKTLINAIKELKDMFKTQNIKVDVQNSTLKVKY